MLEQNGIWILNMYVRVVAVIYIKMGKESASIKLGVFKNYSFSLLPTNLINIEN